MAAASPQYRWPEVVLLRAGTDPGGLELPHDLDLTTDDVADDGVRWLSQLWQREEVRAAVHGASPSLTQAIEQLTTAEQPDHTAVRRAVASVASYLLRWRGRCTPFGRFAGVAIAHIGREPKIRWGSDHRVTSRMDAGLLASVIAHLQAVPELRDQLHVVINNTATLRGGRLVAPGVPSAGDTTSLASLEVSVPATPPVLALLEIAARPVRYSELRTLLSRRFPVDDQQRIDMVLEPLLDQRLLISGLWAPSTCQDTLSHLCEELVAAGANTIPEIADLVRELQATREALSDTQAIGELPRELGHRLCAFSLAARQPFASDTVLDCDVQIPKQLAQEASDAAQLLLRLSPHAVGDPIWRDYHARFRARYGVDALVPVLELVADSGLGYPVGYLGSARSRAQSTVQERDRVLASLIQRATMDGAEEIVLTEELVDALANGELRDMQLPARIEVAVEVQSASIEDLKYGRFMLAVTGAPRPGSSMIGRFVDLLPADDRAALAENFAVTNEDAVAVQLSFPPRQARNENITRTGRLLPHVLPLSEHHGRDPHLVALADVAVTTIGPRFEVIEISTGRRIEPRVLHALQSTTQMPALARLLSELPTARCTRYGAFSLGLSEALPYVPSFRYRRTVLSPAQWRLERARMPKRHAPNRDWAAALTEWRRGWRVPRYVALLDHDRRQPLDLDHPLHRQLLRDRLDRIPAVRLQKTAEPAQLGWIGRSHELVFPLLLDNPDSAAQDAVTAPAPSCLAMPSDTDFPGASQVVCARLYGHPDRFDTILTEHLPVVLNSLAAQGKAPLWWFRRHRDFHRPDTDQYIALYLRMAEPNDYAAATAVLGQWAQRLRLDRLLADLTLSTHEPHTQRWGTGTALDAARAVFAADSAAAIAQISLSLREGVDATALSAASLVDLADSVAASHGAGTAWLRDELTHERGRLVFELRDLAWQLHSAAQSGLAPIAAGSPVHRAWRARATTAAAFREAFPHHRIPNRVLHDLAHLHHIRAIGVDPDREQVARRLARACALRHAADPRER